ncbi:uncharacterized protein LOC132299891 isoform X2 [Cornus florida]|uniref:uncharacterized protein LOC132299891 isoform X2 n=1 Tax=Cornus florida TaxID=4283 RepID=UPI00289F3BB1|nr:uncharacterized protein LOC132299891 isoform X2 [Cornus florida]
MTGSGLTVTTKNFASAQKEFLDRIHAAAVARKIGIGGRKMAVDKENSKISGKDTEASNTSLKRPQYHSIDQNNSNMLELKTSKSASLGIPGTEPVHF